MSVFVAVVGDPDYNPKKLFYAVQEEYSVSIQLCNSVLLIKTDHSAFEISTVFEDALQRVLQRYSFKNLQLIVTEVTPGESILPSPQQEDTLAYEYIMEELSPKSA